MHQPALMFLCFPLRSDTKGFGLDLDAASLKDFLVGYCHEREEKENISLA